MRFAGGRPEISLRSEVHFFANHVNRLNDFSAVQGPIPSRPTYYMSLCLIAPVCVKAYTGLLSREQTPMRSVLASLYTRFLCALFGTSSSSSSLLLPIPDVTQDLYLFCPGSSAISLVSLYD